jgi:cell wall-associated NlpC family hydrolase
LLRPILTGFFVFALSAGVSVPALADPATDLGPTPATTAAAANAPSATENGPTDGADLAMWNVEPTKSEIAPAPAPSRTSRILHFLHVQRFASGIAARGAAMASSLTRNALRFLGVPYAFGGTTAGGFDCSGYTQHVFAMMGLHLPRTADAQYAVTHPIEGSPKPGDLVFFQTYAPGASHVGISLGGDRFVHASSSHGVTVSSLHESYWSARYLGAKRVDN